METDIDADVDVLDALKALRSSVARLEAERDCADVLSKYGFYADHKRLEEWIKLWTEDCAFDVVSGDPGKHIRFEGHSQIRDVIYSPVGAEILGRCQHAVGGPPRIFRLIDDQNAVMVTYSVVVYAKEDPDLKVINHAMNRWSFRKIDGQWYIAENIRRRMGDPASASIFEDF